MKRALQKLHGSTGASMLLGLLFLLFCLTVGAVVLTAASVSAGRTARNRQVQQNYLAVQSAANLLMDDLADITFTDTYTHTEVTYHHYSTDSEGNTVHTTSSGPDIDELEPECVGTELKTKGLTEYMEQMFLCQETIKGYNRYTPPPLPYQTPLTIQENETSTDDPHGLPAVTVDLTFGGKDNAGTETGLKAGYTITAQVYLTDPGPEGSHKMTLEWTPEVKVTAAQNRHYWVGSGEERYETAFACEVTWTVSQVTKGGTT